MKIGYARVSTADQLLDLQTDALLTAGCEKIFTDVASGVKADRPELAQALEFVRAGDSFVVWRMDRLSRSLQQLIAAVNLLGEKEVEFVSLTEGFDTSGSGGRLLYQIFGAIAEYERAIIQERVRAGLAAARARGRYGGRPKKLKPNQLGVLRGLIVAQVEINQICETLSISKTTYYRYLNAIAANAS